MKYTMRFSYRNEPGGKLKIGTSTITSNEKGDAVEVTRQDALDMLEMTLGRKSKIGLEIVRVVSFEKAED